MTNKKLREFTNFSMQLADISGKIIKKYFRHELFAEYKEAESPIVTIADKETEAALRKAIEKKYPDHGINGEEYGIKAAGSEYKWVLDPIDGTIAFTCGKPIFGTLISLMRADKYLLGIIDQPILKERWLGLGSETLFNGKKTKTSGITDIKKARLATTTASMFKTESQNRAFRALSDSVHVTTFGGDCYNYALLANGTIDIVIERTLKLHDYAALIPVIEGAGGTVTDWKGNPVSSQGDILACASRDLHRSVIEKISIKDF
jgi:inositol-phosphate phosphatase / L-galactose 1-phosphate phosphatase / histidinol-phosphatase